MDDYARKLQLADFLRGREMNGSRYLRRGDG